jgi:hypothetical protein
VLMRARLAALPQVLHERCMEVGIEEFICKPFRVEDVQRVVSNPRRVSRRDWPPGSPPADP